MKKYFSNVTQKLPTFKIVKFSAWRIRNFVAQNITKTLHTNWSVFWSNIFSLIVMSHKIMYLFLSLLFQENHHNAQNLQEKQYISSLLATASRNSCPHLHYDDQCNFSLACCRLQIAPYIKDIFSFFIFHFFIYVSTLFLQFFIF